MTRIHPFPGDGFPEPLSRKMEDALVWSMVWPDRHLAADPRVRRHILGRHYASLLMWPDDPDRPPDESIFRVPSPN